MTDSNVPPSADEAAGFDDALTDDAQAEDSLTDDDARTDDGSPVGGDADFAGVDITERDGPDLEREDRTDR
jgi:hypothetical protein